ncbi:MAG: acyl transferase [Bacteroidetes bacterium]|nr:acyl transferase [Bacteroidota bacterium]
MGSFDVNNIFSLSGDPAAFLEACLHTSRWQYRENPVYREWCQLTGADPAKCKTLVSIPALPISFFKSREVVSGQFQPEVIFESSGTTQQLASRHLVKTVELYRRSFREAFRLFYGEVTEWCILGLLPSYLERQYSSLVMMVDELIRASAHPNSGFYLYDHQQLSDVLQQQEIKGQKTLLIGVTFALLDFAASHPQQLVHTVVMETGGMKGRRKELTRAEVHRLLTEGLGVTSIHAEYGMTELLSQAYSKGEGRFRCPPWMKVLVRDEEDPFSVKQSGRGILQVIDLANRHSISFIATEDVGQVFGDGSFEVWGRLDNSDIRGCSQLVV